MQKIQPKTSRIQRTFRKYCLCLRFQGVMSSTFDIELRIFLFANFLTLGVSVLGSVGLSLVYLCENSCFASENRIFALVFMLNFNETSRTFVQANRNDACELFGYM